MNFIGQLAISNTEARIAKCASAAECVFTNQKTSCYSYKRKLKAAEAMKSATMVTSDNQKSTAVVPGTNKYTMEGSEVTCLKMLTELQQMQACL